MFTADPARSPPPDVPGLDWWVERFEEAWAAGLVPSLEDYLPAEAASRLEVLTELLLVDLEHRWRRAGPGSEGAGAPAALRLEDYYRQFPELGPPEQLPLDCLVQEYWVRRRWGDAPPPEDYARRFPDRAAELLPALARADADLRDEGIPPPGPSPNPETLPGTSSPAQDHFPRLPGHAITDEIGRGGMAVVYRARQLALNRTVAVKMLPDRSHFDPRALARFFHEAAAVAQLQHPNIIQVHAVGTHEGRPYCCLEYAAGGSLARQRGGTPLPPDDAARLVEVLARAMQVVHQRGIIHRDLKPANVLLAEDGTPKIADFGLARYLSEPGLTQTGSILGTPSYMAPEQAAGDSRRVGPSADVYALGAVLYELLTGRPPFRAATVLETLEQVRSQEPVPVRQLQPKVPRDLETVCLKCLQKEPGRRYATAGALADDLGRFLRREPIRARPVGRVERLGRWCRRHPSTAVPLAGVLLLLLVVATLLYRRVREQEQELFVQKAQAALAEQHREGWRERLLGQIAAARLRRGGAVRDLAAAALAGLDARLAADLRGHEAAGVAFDPGGRRLLLGGTNDRLARPQAPATLWDLDTSARHHSAQPGAGPVLFRRGDGVPVQLLARPGPGVLLWDVAGQRPVCEGRFDPGGARHRDWQFVVSEAGDRQLLALADDGSLLAAAFAAGDEGRVVVWDGGTGRLLRQIPARATALAFTPGGTAGRPLLAVGDAEGRITFWPVSGPGPAGPALRRGRAAICSLAFRDAGLLAAGDASGTVTIWQRQGGKWVLVTPCPGSPYAVYSLAFSPDNATLASGGRDAVHFWDVATGRPLLRVSAGEYITGIAFAPSPAGGRLAVTTADRDPAYRGACVWELEPGRGVATLRGLSGQVARVVLSPDGRLVAALAHDWRVGVWELDTGRLRHLLEAPPGEYADNAALAFRDDGRRLAFAGGKQARLWDADTGAELARWALPVGLCDGLAFDAGGRLRSFRLETEDGKLPPYTSAPFPDHPRVFRLRELPPAGGPRDLARFDDFNVGAEMALALPDGRFLATGVRQEGDGPRTFALKAFVEGRGEALWQVPLPEKDRVLADPAGRVLAVRSVGNEPGATLLDAADGRERHRLAGGTFLALAPGAEHWVCSAPGDSGTMQRGVGYCGRGRPAPLVTLGTRAVWSSNFVFDRSGNLLVWGNEDGSVCVCNLAEVRAQLRALGLDWDE